MSFSESLPRLAVIAMMITVAGGHAHDLGTQGPSYPVKEPDLLETIETRLKQKQSSGELQRLQREAADRARALAESPPPVKKVRTTRKARIYDFDPAYTAPTTVRGPEGEVLVAAGTRVNPLDYVGLSRPLYFFDGRDDRQMRMALAANKAIPGGVKLVMTAGQPLEFMRKYRVRTFFDQGGTLVARLGIRQVPARVAQHGKVLRIEEIVAK